MRLLIQCILFLFCISFLYAADNALALQDFIHNLETTCPGFTDNNLTLAKADAALKEGRAVLYPVISISAPVNYQYNPQRVIFSTGNTEVLALDGSSLAVIPEVSISQYLPTAGVLGVALKSSYSQMNIAEISPAEYAALAEQQGFPANTNIFRNTPNLAISYTQPLTFENSYQAGLTLLQASYAMAKKNFHITRNLLVYNGVRSFCELAVLDKALQLAKSGFQLATNTYQETDQDYKLGRATQVLLLKAQAALKKAELEVTSAQDAYTITFAQFRALYGIAPDARISINQDYPATLINTDHLTDEVLQNNPELRIAADSCRISQANLTQAKAANVFTLGLGANWLFDSNETRITEPGRAFASPFTDSGNTGFTLNVTLSGKLFDGNVKKQKIQQAELNVQIAERALTAKKAELQNQLKRLQAAVAKCQSNVEYQKINLQVAKLEYDNVTEKLALGQVSRLELQLLTRNLDTARMSLIQAQNDWLFTSLELLILAGTDLWEYFQKGSE